MNEKPLSTATLREKVIPAKSFFQSKTIWGLIIIVGLTIARFFGYDVEAEAGKSGELLNTVGWVLTLLGIRTAKQPLQFFPDDKSANGAGMPLLVMAATLGTALALGVLVSCSNSSVSVRPTADGCLEAKRTTESGQDYIFKYCLDGRYEARWHAPQNDGTTKEIRYTRWRNGRDEIEYRDGELWLAWDDKSGVQIGGVPVSGNDALALPRRGGNHGPPIVSREAGIVPQK